MKPALLLLLAALPAGCLAAEDAAPLAGADAEPFPWRSEGAFFVEPSQGRELSMVEVPFLVNRTGATVAATVTVGARYGPLEFPRATAYVEARLVDAAGDTLAEARRMPAGEPTITLEAKDVPAGEATLVLGIGGGSDGEANGDHVAYVLDAR